MAFGVAHKPTRAPPPPFLRSHAGWAHSCLALAPSSYGSCDPRAVRAQHHENERQDPAQSPARDPDAIACPSLREGGHRKTSVSFLVQGGAPRPGPGAPQPCAPRPEVEGVPEDPLPHPRAHRAPRVAHSLVGHRPVAPGRVARSRRQPEQHEAPGARRESPERGPPAQAPRLGAPGLRHRAAPALPAEHAQRRAGPPRPEARAAGLLLGA